MIFVDKRTPLPRRAQEAAQISTYEAIRGKEEAGRGRKKREPEQFNASVGRIIWSDVAHELRPGRVKRDQWVARAKILLGVREPT